MKRLNRECSLFTNDSKYLIVAAAFHISADRFPGFYSLLSNNETITPNLRYEIIIRRFQRMCISLLFFNILA